jgi:hypothetical protein
VSAQPFGPRAAAALAVTLLSLPAGAQTFGPRDGTRPFETPQNFAIELRLGSFSENIDGQLGLAGRGPYQQIFCSTRDSNAAASAPVTCPFRTRFGVEGDWEIVRLGPVGLLGVGAFAMYGNASARAPAADGMSSADATTWRRSAQDTSLQVVSTAVFGLLRLDGLARRIRWIPIVPYAKAGLALAPWWVTSGDQLAKDSMGNDAIGLSQGLFVAGGLSLMLDSLEPHTARQWDQTSGVNHSFVFFELNYSYLGGITRRTLDVGGLAWTAGVMAEF